VLWFSRLALLHRCHPGWLWRRYFHACGDKRTVGRHRAAAGCGPLGGNDGGVASDSAI